MISKPAFQWSDQFEQERHLIYRLLQRSANVYLILPVSYGCIPTAVLSHTNFTLCPYQHSAVYSDCWNIQESSITYNMERAKYLRFIGM